MQWNVEHKLVTDCNRLLEDKCRGTMWQSKCKKKTRWKTRDRKMHDFYRTVPHINVYSYIKKKMY